MNKKHILFTLTGSLVMTCAAQPDPIDLTSVTQDPTTSSSLPIQFLEQQLCLNRPSNHDPHTTIPYFESQKLRINVAQSAHILVIIGTILSMKPRMEPFVVAHCGGVPIPWADVTIPSPHIS